jgi:tetratricopeptide (TPR) repeat protein
MTSTPLLEILKTLQPAEHRRLALFLVSPYHVTHGDLPRLHAILRDAVGQKTEAASSPPALFAALFPGRPYDAQALHHRMSWLLKAVEQFLALETWQAEPSAPGLALQRAYNDRHLDRPFAHARKFLEKQRLKDPVRNAETLRRQYELELEDYRQAARLSRTAPLNLRQVSGALDEAFIAEKLRVACLQLSRLAVVGQDASDPGLLPAVLNRVEADPELLGHPAVAVYYHAYRALENPAGAEHFHYLKRRLTEQPEHFPPAERQTLFLLAINYGIRRLNSGEAPWVREVFDLYDAGLRTGDLLEKGQLSRFTFNNIVIAGLRLREDDWVRSFIENYQKHLDPATRLATVNFNLGKFCYETGRWDEAQQHLARMDYDDPLHNLAARVLLAKIYYERGNWDALDSLLGSLGLYLRRQKLLGYHKSNYQNFLRALRRIMQADPDKSITLRAELEKTEPLTERSWLLKQLDG